MLKSVGTIFLFWVGIGCAHATSSLGDEALKECIYMVERNNNITSVDKLNELVQNNAVQQQLKQCLKHKPIYASRVDDYNSCLTRCAIDFEWGTFSRLLCELACNLI